MNNIPQITQNENAFIKSIAIFVKLNCRSEKI